jgi:hypothetical protein
MDLTKEEIKQEFDRQVSLCKGIGYKEMIDTINKSFNISTRYETTQLNQLRSIATSIQSTEDGEAIIQLIANGNKLDPYIAGNLGQMQAMIVGMAGFNDDFKELIIDAAEELK